MQYWNCTEVKAKDSNFNEKLPNIADLLNIKVAKEASRTCVQKYVLVSFYDSHQVWYH